MARPREFDEQQATEAAMNVFWEHGYDGASIALLLDGMGMTKGSLYKAFNDKRSLFLTAMARYEAAQVAPAIAVLQDDTEPDGRKRIARVFESVAQAVRNGDRRGCLLCSAAAGPSFDDPEIAEVVDGLLDDLRLAFEVALGSVMAPEQSEAMARVLQTQYVGLRILARAQVPADDLDRSARAVLAVLGDGSGA
ncbi:TetR/AcrR family transcriptional regulator [Gymnodinialimonas hymeniacidonis]|uniref:TetR/AcrR family transcriptional regulator n=1 Tax=Gymnodinialimonas hymeniacidonis TaxID=3126508 RepID=UPI0034C63314